MKKNEFLLWVFIRELLYTILVFSTGLFILYYLNRYLES